MPGPGGDLSKMANCGQKQEAALDRYSSVSSSAIEWCHFRPVGEARSGSGYPSYVPRHQRRGRNPSDALHFLSHSIKPLDISITSLYLRFHSLADLHMLEKWAFTANSVKTLCIKTQTTDELGIFPPSFFRHVGNISTLNFCDTTASSGISLTTVKVLNVYSEFDTLSPDELRDLCLQLPSLETLCMNLSVDGSDWGSGEHRPAIQISIKELQVSLGGPDSSLVAFRTCIELPQLQTLYCMSIGSTNLEFVDQLTNKLVSVRSLRRLCLSSRNDGTPEDEMYSLGALDRLSHIEHIRFEYIDARLSTLNGTRCSRRSSHSAHSITLLPPVMSPALWEASTAG
jgi:hypothetical protein